MLSYKAEQQRTDKVAIEKKRQEMLAQEEKMKLEQPEAYAKMMADKEAESRTQLAKQNEVSQKEAMTRQKAVDSQAAVVSTIVVVLFFALIAWIGWLGSAIKTEILAGDFKTGIAPIYHIPFKGKYITLKSSDGGTKMLKKWKVEKISLSELDAVDEVTKENEKKFGGSLGASLVGGAIFGGAGLLAGALSGGSKTKIAFAATFKDGRRFLGTVDGKEFLVLKAAAFK